VVEVWQTSLNTFADGMIRNLLKNGLHILQRKRNGLSGIYINPLWVCYFLLAYPESGRSSGSVLAKTTLEYGLLETFLLYVFSCLMCDESENTI
jgi:hypothetical protein